MGTLVNTGASLTFSTVIKKLCTANAPEESVTLNTTAWSPTSSFTGVLNNAPVPSPLSSNSSQAGRVDAVINSSSPSSTSSDSIE